MFGFGKKKMHHVVLTDQELHRLLGTMSRQERREFERRQEDAWDDAYDEGFLDGMIIGDD